MPSVTLARVDQPRTTKRVLNENFAAIQSALETVPTLSDVEASIDAAVSGIETGEGTTITVADTSSIDLTLFEGQLSASAIFGTSAGTVAEGSHTHAGSGLTHPQVLARGLGA